MFGLFLENKSAAEAAEKIISLKEKFSKTGIRFGDTCPLILTDNGGEFANISGFELDEDGEPDTCLFFCDPMHSYQKPKVEKNHAYIGSRAISQTKFLKCGG